MLDSTVLTITESAKNHFTDQISKRPGGWGIYVGVQKAGCSGLAYVIEFWDDAKCNDNMFRPEKPHRINDIPIIMNPLHYIYLEGMEIDYVVEGLQTGLKFNNPNSKSECGCGESIQF